MSDPATPRVNHAVAFITNFRARAPKTAIVIAALSAMAIAPPQVQAEGSARLQAEIPAAHATALLHSLTSAPAGELCFGPVKPTGDRPVVLAFDRHLSVAMWLDGKGLPTNAPSHFTNTDVLILGNAPDANTPSHVTYIFAERQDPRAQQQTFQKLRDQLSAVDLHTVEAVRAGPLAGCQLADIKNYPTPEQPGMGQRIAAAVGAQVSNEVTWRVGSAASNAVGGAITAVAHGVGITP